MLKTKKSTKTVKVKVEKYYKNLEGYYHKDNIFLGISKDFIYRMTVYKILANGVVLFDSKETSFKEFKKFEISSIIKKDNIDFLQVITLISAPLDFLNNNNFKKYGQT